MKEGTQSKHTNRVSASMAVDMASESQRKAVMEAIDVMKVPKGSKGGENNKRTGSNADENDPEKKAKKEARLRLCFLCLCTVRKQKERDLCSRTLLSVLATVCFLSDPKGPIFGWQDAKRSQRLEEGPWHGGLGCFPVYVGVGFSGDHQRASKLERLGKDFGRRASWILFCPFIRAKAG